MKVMNQQKLTLADVGTNYCNLYAINLTRGTRLPKTGRFGLNSDFQQLKWENFAD